MKKRILSVFLCLAFFTPWNGIRAESSVGFDPSQYAAEDLIAIENEIDHYLPQTQGYTVAFDSDAFHVEYVDIYQYADLPDKQYWIKDDPERADWVFFNFLFQNNSGKDVWVSLSDLRINGCTISCVRSFMDCVKDGSTVLAKRQDSLFRFNRLDLRDYGINTVHRVDFSLIIRETYLDDGGYRRAGNLIEEIECSAQVNQPLAFMQEDAE